MTTRARWLIVAAALFLSAGFFLPLWRVSLVAPQYPEGLGMLIRIDGVQGIKEQDLQSINGLNHYIGMHAIEPDEIEELGYMPFILGGLIVAGLAVAAWGRRVPLYVYTALLLGVLSLGLWDYWRWGYEYGHDLDMEHAIIKIPGMTYSPPVIGRKKLLNFTATSWPASGGIALALASGLVLVAAWDSKRSRARARAAAAVALVAAACGGTGPRAIALGSESCEYCRMQITDARFGAEAVSSTGRVRVFDSVDCLAGYVRGAAQGSVEAIYVTDSDAPGTFVEAAKAGFLVGSSVRSPMGETVAFASPEAARTAQAAHGGVLATWEAVLEDSSAHAGR